MSPVGDKMEGGAGPNKPEPKDPGATPDPKATPEKLKPKEGTAKGMDPLKPE